MGEAIVHRAKRPHAKEVLFDALSLLPMGGEKNLEGMGEAAVHGRKRFLDCMRVRLLPMGPRDHLQERFYLTRSLCCPWGERKNLEGMGEVTVHGAKSLHTKEDNIMPVVNEWIP